MLPNQGWRSQCGKLASIDRTGQQLGLFGEATRIGDGQLLAEEWQVLQPTPNTEVVGVGEQVSVRRIRSLRSSPRTYCLANDVW